MEDKKCVVGEYFFWIVGWKVGLFFWEVRIVEDEKFWCVGIICIVFVNEWLRYVVMKVEMFKVLNVFCGFVIGC